jgi:hypothetical protein
MGTSMDRSPRLRIVPPAARVAVGAHLLVVLGLSVAFTAMMLTTADDAGANIGAGIVGLVLIGLGQPWSSLIPFVFTGAPVDYLLLIAPALLNVALHLLGWHLIAAVRRAAARRQR